MGFKAPSNPGCSSTLWLYGDGVILTWPKVRWKTAQNYTPVKAQCEGHSSQLLSGWSWGSSSLQHCQSTGVKQQYGSTARHRPWTFVCNKGDTSSWNAFNRCRLLSQATWKGSRLQVHGGFLNLLKMASPKLRHPTDTLTAVCFQTLYCCGGFKYTWQKKPALTYAYTGIITLVTLNSSTKTCMVILSKLLWQFNSGIASFKKLWILRKPSNFLWNYRDKKWSLLRVEPIFNS